MKLCIASPNSVDRTPGFIFNQVKFLKPDLFLNNGWLPIAEGIEERHLNNLLIDNKFLRGFSKKVIPALYEAQYKAVIGKTIQKKKINLILAQYGPMGVNFLDIANNARVPLITHFHGFDAYHYPTLAQYKDAYKKLFEESAGLIAVSKDMQQQLISLGANEKKVFLNPYGVDVDFFKSTDPISSGKEILFVGRLTPKKAPDLTIKAFALILEKHPDAVLNIIAPFEQLYEDVKKLITELHLENKVFLLGRKNQNEILEYLKRSRLFVQHSLRSENGDAEGTPNTILEASSSGLPIVSTYHAGIKEAVIHGETGFLTHEGDYKKMAEYMDILLNDAHLAQKMGEKAREHMINNYELNTRMIRLRDYLHSFQ